MASLDRRCRIELHSPGQQMGGIIGFVDGPILRTYEIWCGFDDLGLFEVLDTAGGHFTARQAQSGQFIVRFDPLIAAARTTGSELHNYVRDITLLSDPDIRYDIDSISQRGRREALIISASGGFLAGLS